MRAVSDTSPLSYLVLIGQAELVPELFDAVTIPGEVRAELASNRAPSAIQQWIERPPTWLEIDADPLPVDAALDRLHAGERAAAGRAPGQPRRSALKAPQMKTAMRSRDGTRKTF